MGREERERRRSKRRDRPLPVRRDGRPERTGSVGGLVLLLVLVLLLALALGAVLGGAL